MADTTALFFLSQENHVLGYFLFISFRQEETVGGLSEETIMGHLKTRTYAATTERVDQGPDICVICQSEYETDELIGGLHCRHEYHVECINKWLQQNNSCPICKAAAVSQNVDKL